VPRSRRKRDTSPIEYDEVVDSPSLKGMVSFLEIPPGQLPRLTFPAPVLELPPASRSEDPGVPEKGVPSDRHTSVYKESRAPDTSEKGTPQTGPLPSALDKADNQPDVKQCFRPLGLTPKPLRRAILAQDGHSLGEQALYDALWQHSQPYQNQREARIITIGYRQMAQLARLTVNNCKANILSLIQKLAVRKFRHSHTRRAAPTWCTATQQWCSVAEKPD
jgi:hypothetical protein